MVKITGAQAVYQGQVWKVREEINSLINVAVELKAKSHDGSWEQREATKMVDDLRRWERCWREYYDRVRQRPDKMFTY